MMKAHMTTNTIFSVETAGLSTIILNQVHQLQAKPLLILTVNGTFRSENDLVGLYWYSADPITHSHISYGNRSNYSDVILEFDYEMEGCTDFSNGNVNIVIESNDGEIFYLTMARFVEGNHVTLDFNNLGLSDASSLKSVMFEIKPVNYAGYSTQ